MRLTFFFIAAALVTLYLGHLAANAPDRTLMSLGDTATPGRNLDDVEDAFRAHGFQVHAGRYFAEAEYFSRDLGSDPMAAVGRDIQERALGRCSWECQIVVARQTEHVTWLGNRHTHHYQYVVVAVDGVVTDQFEDHVNWAWSF